MRIVKTLLKQLIERTGYQIVKDSADGVTGAALSVARTATLNGIEPTHLLEAANSVGHLACLKELLRSEQIKLVIDVGAFEGQFARRLRGIGYAGRIVSCEPNPEVLGELRRLSGADSDWTVLDCGIGGEHGHANLTTFNAPSFTSTKQINARARTRFGEMVQPKNVYRIQIRTLTEIVEELGIGLQINRAMLKVDTQGADLEVLRGAKGLLSQFRIVQVEAAIQPLYEAAPLLSDFVSLLSRHGFQLSHISGISHEPRGLAILEADCIFCRSPKP